MNVTIVTSEALVKALQTKKAAIHKAVARAITQGAILVQGKARTKILKGPKSGHIYGAGISTARSVRALKAALKRAHQASAPGEPPANDTGNLARSVKVLVAKPGMYVTAYVQADAGYAQALEFGTQTMEPRPFMQPSADESKAKIKEIMNAELAAAIES